MTSHERLVHQPMQRWQSIREPRYHCIGPEATLSFKKKVAQVIKTVRFSVICFILLKKDSRVGKL